MPAYKPVTARSAAPRPASKLLYRAEEAAVIMSLSRTAVFGLIRSGDLDTIKIGHRRRIPRSSIEDYITRQLTVGDDAEIIS
jgi:excisionase family DNA binding protein